jgi:hypothetical protein
LFEFLSCELKAFVFFFCVQGSGNKFRGASLFSGLDAFGETRLTNVENYAPAKVTPANAWKLMNKKTAFAVSAEERAVEEGNVIAYRIPTPTGMHWLLSVPPAHIYAPPSPIHLIYVLDRSKRCVNLCLQIRIEVLHAKQKSMGSSFSRLVVPACKQLYRAVAPVSAQIVLFGSTVELIPADMLRNAGPAFFDTLEVVLSVCIFSVSFI